MASGFILVLETAIYPGELIQSVFTRGSFSSDFELCLEQDCARIVPLESNLDASIEGKLLSFANDCIRYLVENGCAG